MSAYVSMPLVCLLSLFQALYNANTSLSALHPHPPNPSMHLQQGCRCGFRLVAAGMTTVTAQQTMASW